MSKVLILTDTVSGISPELAQQYGIKVVPGANIVMDGKSYPDGTSITADEAYRFLQKNPEKFSSATLNPSYLLDLYRTYSQESTEMLFLTFTSTMSAANKIANMAAEELKKESPQVNLRVIDTKRRPLLRRFWPSPPLSFQCRFNLDQITDFITEPGRRPAVS